MHSTINLENVALLKTVLISYMQTQYLDINASSPDMSLLNVQEIELLETPEDNGGNIYKGNQLLCWGSPAPRYTLGIEAGMEYEQELERRQRVS